MFPKDWFEWVELCLVGETAVFWFMFTIKRVVLNPSGYKTGLQVPVFLLVPGDHFSDGSPLLPQCKAMVEHAVVQEARVSFVGLHVFTLLLPKEGPWQPLLSGCQKN